MGLRERAEAARAAALARLEAFRATREGWTPGGLGPATPQTPAVPSDDTASGVGTFAAGFVTLPSVTGWVNVFNGDTGPHTFTVTTRKNVAAAWTIQAGYGQPFPTADYATLMIDTPTAAVTWFLSRDPFTWSSGGPSLALAAPALGSHSTAISGVPSLTTTDLTPAAGTIWHILGVSLLTELHNTSGGAVTLTLNQFDVRVFRNATVSQLGQNVNPGFQLIASPGASYTTPSIPNNSYFYNWNGTWASNAAPPLFESPTGSANAQIGTGQPMAGELILTSADTIRGELTTTSVPTLSGAYLTLTLFGWVEVLP